MITSTANPLVKDLVRLRSRRHRDRERRFIIEGARQVAAAARARVGIDLVVVAPELGGVPVTDTVAATEMGEEAFRKVSIRQKPDGVLAVAGHLDTSLDRLELPDQPLLLVVEAIEKPGNLGAMLRTCDAVGVDAVLVADPTVDVHNPNVVQASQGALFSVPLAVGPRDDVLEFLFDRDVELVATTPDGGEPLWDSDLTGAKALAVGSEATGLSPELLAAAQQKVVIPMRGAVDSLNASVSAAIALYEAARQRR